MFVSKLKVICLLALIAGGASAKSHDTNYNPEHSDTLKLVKHSLEYSTIPSTDGTVLTLCELQAHQSYELLIDPKDDSCYPIIEIFEKITIQSLNHFKETRRTNLPPNIKFNFVATAPCMDLYIDRGDCSSQQAFAISIYQKNKLANGISRNGGIKTDYNYTAEELVQDVLVGGGCFDIVPGSIKSIGRDREDYGLGYFSGGQDGIGIEEGVILSSGHIDNAQGPNDYDASSGYLNTVGEDDLELLVDGAFIQDASGLEFEFIPTTNQIQFRYVFASEEYCEYADSKFNDVFGFFIRGAGINGGFTGNAENIALIPGTNQRVSINSVNHMTNASFYVKNERRFEAFGCQTPYNPQALEETEYDGFTVVLTATVEVIPCQVYHIKLVVADVTDARLDSAVFLEANSFEAGGQATVSTDVPYNPANVAYESCKESYFKFERADEDLSEPVVVKFHLSDRSTAESGVDFSPLPDSIIIPAGETVVYLPVEIFEDNEIENLEEILIQLENPCSCRNPFTTLSISDKPPLELTGKDEIVCKDEEATLSIDITGGAKDYAYQWSTNAADTFSTLIVNTNVNASYQVTITDFCGATAEEELKVTVLAEPVATISGTDQLCPEHTSGYVSVDLVGNGPWTIEYSIDGVTQAAITEIENSTYQLPVSQLGTYELISVEDNGCPGIINGQAEVIETQIELVADMLPVSCNDKADGSIDLAISGNGIAPFEFLWSNGTKQKDANNLAEGEYGVLLIDANGCTKSSIFSVILDPEIPEAVASVDRQLTCAETKINLSGNGSSDADFYAYNWTSMNGNITDGKNSLNPIVNQPGDYFLAVTNTKSNCTVSTEVKVDADIEAPQLDLHTLSAQSVIDCNVESIVLDAATNLPASMLEFNWTTENGHILSDANTPNPEVDQGGDYFLEITNSRNGCTTTKKITIPNNIKYPSIVFGDVPLLTCKDSIAIVDATASSSGSNFNYEWTTVDGTIDSGESTLSATVSGASDYVLKIINIENGCETEQTIEVIEDIQKPKVDAGNTAEIICDRPVIALDGSASERGSQFVYQWSTEEGRFLESTQEITTSVDIPGMYWLRVTNTINGCSATDEVVITENTNRPTAAEITPTPPLCFGDKGAIAIGNIAGGVGPFVYSFDEGNNFTSQSTTNLNPATYQIVIMDSNGCTYQEEISIPPAFELMVHLEKELTIQLGDQQEINATVNIPESQIGQITWTPNDSLSCNNCLTPKVNPIHNMDYTITVVDQNACEAKASILLRVDKEPLIYIPNAFSPNNIDGMNDVFMIYAKESSVRKINTFQVYNRWGGKVFEANDFLPNDSFFSWDGKSRGKRLSPAVFIYFAEIEFIDGRTELFKGDVLLMN